MEHVEQAGLAFQKLYLKMAFTLVIPEERPLQFSSHFIMFK